MSIRSMLLNNAEFIRLLDSNGKFVFNLPKSITIAKGVSIISPDSGYSDAKSAVEQTLPVYAISNKGYFMIQSDVQVYEDGTTQIDGKVYVPFANIKSIQW